MLGTNEDWRLYRIRDRIVGIVVRRKASLPLNNETIDLLDRDRLALPIRSYRLLSNNTINFVWMSSQ